MCLITSPSSTLLAEDDNRTKRYVRLPRQKKSVLNQSSTHRTNSAKLRHLTTWKVFCKVSSYVLVGSAKLTCRKYYEALALLKITKN